MLYVDLAGKTIDPQDLQNYTVITNNTVIE